MPVLAFLGLLVQVGLAVHVFKTGRDRWWIWLILFVPGIGCLVYFIVEVLPGMGSSREMKKAKAGVLQKLDPTKNLRLLRQRLEFSDTFINRKALADECMSQGLLEEALALYEQCLEGIHRQDAGILFSLSHARFGTGKYKEALESLEALSKVDQDFRPAESHLLYVRCLEQLGRDQEALQEYSVLVKHFSGEEVRCRYAMLLQKTGRVEEAQDLFKKMIKESKMAPKYYRRQQKMWINAARQNLAG